MIPLPARRWLWAALITGLLLMVVGSGPAASAQDTNEDFATIEVDIIGQVPWEERRSVNATVLVETERAVSGTLSIANRPDGGSLTTFEYDVDLAAGTAARFPVTFTTGWNGIEALVSVTSNGEVVATESVEVIGQGSSDGALVATFGIDDPPRRVEELGTELQLATLPLDRTLTGLEVASTVVTTRNALSDLGQDSTALARLEGWIRGGGQLVVDGPTESLDDGFHQFPTANPDRFRYGAGSVFYDEEWEDGLPLGGYLGSVGMQDLVNSQDLGAGSSAELSILAGVALPAALIIGGILFAYTVISGPLLFSVVTAKRIQRRIWVVLPALSLLFTAGLLAYGLIGRGGASEAHVTIVEVNDEGSRATSNLLLTSTLGNNRQLEAPEGWRYLGQGQSGGQRPALVRVGASSIDLSLDLPPGGNGQARLVGPASQFDGALVISDIRVEQGLVQAEVTNNSGHDLSEVVAFHGNAREKIGFLAAGDTITFSVLADDDSGRTMKELLLWPRVEQRWGNEGMLAVPTDREAPTAAGAWTEWRVEQGASFSPDGVVGVAGWSDEIESPVAGIGTGRTALFTRANVPTGAAENGFGAAVRLPSRQVEPIFFDDFAGYAEDYRITLDPDYVLEDLAILVSGQSAALGLFIDGEYQFADIPEAGRQTLSIPPEAVVDGELIVRSYVTDWGWGSGSTIALIRDPNRKAVTVPFTTALQFRGVEGQFFEESDVPEGVPVPDGLEVTTIPVAPEPTDETSEEITTTTEGSAEDVTTTIEPSEATTTVGEGG